MSGLGRNPSIEGISGDVGEPASGADRSAREPLIGSRMIDGTESEPTLAPQDQWLRESAVGCLRVEGAPTNNTSVSYDVIDNGPTPTIAGGPHGSDNGPIDSETLENSPAEVHTTIEDISLNSRESPSSSELRSNSSNLKEDSSFPAQHSEVAVMNEDSFFGFNPGARNSGKEIIPRFDFAKREHTEDDEVTSVEEPDSAEDLRHRFEDKMMLESDELGNYPSARSTGPVFPTNFQKEAEEIDTYILEAPKGGELVRSRSGVPVGRKVVKSVDNYRYVDRGALLPITSHRDGDGFYHAVLIPGMEFRGDKRMFRQKWPDNYSNKAVKDEKGIAHRPGKRSGLSTLSSINDPPTPNTPIDPVIVKSGDLVPRSPHLYVPIGRDWSEEDDDEDFRASYSRELNGSGDSNAMTSQCGVTGERTTSFEATAFPSRREVPSDQSSDRKTEVGGDTPLATPLQSETAELFMENDEPKHLPPGADNMQGVVREEHRPASPTPYDDDFVEPMATADPEENMVRSEAGYHLNRARSVLKRQNPDNCWVKAIPEDPHYRIEVLEEEIGTLRQFYENQLNEVTLNFKNYEVWATENLELSKTERARRNGEQLENQVDRAVQTDAIDEPGAILKARSSSEVTVSEQPDRLPVLNEQQSMSTSDRADQHAETQFGYDLPTSRADDIDSVAKAEPGASLGRASDLEIAEDVQSKSDACITRFKEAEEEPESKERRQFARTDGLQLRDSPTLPGTSSTASPIITPLPLSPQKAGLDVLPTSVRGRPSRWTQRESKLKDEIYAKNRDKLERQRADERSQQEEMWTLRRKVCKKIFGGSSIPFAPEKQLLGMLHSLVQQA